MSRHVSNLLGHDRTVVPRWDLTLERLQRRYEDDLTALVSALSIVARNGLPVPAWTWLSLKCLMPS
jgi:hypothetical protein